jgi:hypothetical protein
MTYASAGTVEANDFNNRANTVNAIWGTGSGSNGYGQSTTISTVAGSSTQNVAASDWATLTTRLNSLTNHQSGTGTLATGFYTAGNLITYWANVDTALSSIQTNKLLFNSTRATAIPTALGGPLMSSSGGWTTSNTNEFSVTFTSTDTVRYFFNAGGIITFYLSQAGGVNTKSTDWATFFTNTIGTISFGSNYCSRSGTGGDQGSATPGGSPTLNTSVGFHSLTTSYQTLFAIGSTSASVDYGNNYITIEAKVGGALYGTGSNIVSFRVIMFDAAADVNADLVDGTTALYVGMTPPEVSNLANTWSFPTAAIVANTQNTLSVTPTIDYLLVGGGGGGGNGIYNRASGGGGGGGGVLYGNAVAVSSATQYNISVGGGGAYLATPGNGVQLGATGTNTTLSLGTVIAYGGGGGGSYTTNSLTGGSTGGSASTSNGLGGYWPNPTGSGQGYGSGYPVGAAGVNTSAAGGGGAGGQGGNGASGVGGAGGIGRSIAITGSSVNYAGGGGGGGQTTGGAAGAGGGGAGAAFTATGAAGANGSPFFGGGGGGGAGGSSAGPYLSAASGGGSGIAIVRYRDIYANATATTGSPTFSYSGGFKVYTWTGVGSITL